MDAQDGQDFGLGFWLFGGVAGVGVMVVWLVGRPRGFAPTFVCLGSWLFGWYAPPPRAYPCVRFAPRPLSFRKGTVEAVWLVVCVRTWHPSRTL